MGEISKDIVSITKDITEDSKEYLVAFTKIHKALHLDFEYNILSPNSLNMTNYSEVAFATDTCN